MHQQRQYRGGKPEVYKQKEVLPSFVPGDIIKERVEEKPTLERLKELVAKRYRFTQDDLTYDLHELIGQKTTDDAMSMATLKEGVDYIVKRLVQVDGSDKNLIKTPAEVNADKVYQNTRMILVSIMDAIKAGHPRSEIHIAVNRQLSMRKLTQYRAEHVTSDILNTMIQLNLIEQHAVKGNIATKFGLTDKGRVTLHRMKDTDVADAKLAVESIKVYQNFMPPQ